MEKTKHITLTIILSLATTITTIALWAGSVSTQQEVNTQRIESLQIALDKEKDERKDENTRIFVELAEIKTGVNYIKEYIDKE
jgi:cell division protein FtsB